MRSSILIVVLGLAVVLPFAEQYAGSVFVLALCYAIVTAGMAVQIGFSQQIAFSQSVFMGAGAYGVAMLNTHLSMPSLLGVPVVMVGSGLAALLLGSVVTRASGLALAVATLMLPLIAVGYLSSAGYLGGSIGTPLTGNLWEGSSTQATAAGNGLITVAVLALVVFACARILSSDIGLELYVLGVDEPTAAAMGVRTPRRKLELFVLGSVFAALGGAIYAGTQLFVPASLVDPTAELTLLMMLFVGGRRSILGAVAGALVIQYLYGASSWVSVNILLVEGVLLTVVLLADPEGLAGIVGAAARRAKPARPAPAPAPAPAVVPLERTNGAIGHARLGVLPDSQRADGAIGALKLLECGGVGKEYGGLSVLDDVTLALPARGLFGLCGPNGAGKSTLLGVIGGSVRPSHGQVLLDGEDVTGLPPQERFGRGVCRTFQAVHLIRGRTVLDNVAVACLSSHQSSIVRGIVRSRLAQAREKAAEALGSLGMGHLSGQDVSSLTLENQRMVEFARAIAARPRLLLLDEPASGLSGPQRERLAEVLRAVGERTCVLLVEHDLDLVARISQQIFVLARGQLVFDGSPEDFRSSDLVNSLLIGGLAMTAIARRRVLAPVTVTALLAGAAALAGCGSGTGASSGGLAAKAPIVICGDLALSGPYAQIGQTDNWGATAFFHHINAAGGILGHQVRYIVENNQSSASQAELIARKCILSEHAKVIVGPESGADTEAALPIAIAYHTILISLSSGWQTNGYPANELTSWGFPGFYDVFYEDQLASVQKLIGPRHYTRVALLEDNCGPVCLANQGSVQALARQYGFQLVSTQVDQVGATDVTPQVLAMLAAKPQIILFGLVPGTDSITAIRAIRAQDPEIPISECSACELPSFIAAAGGASVMHNIYVLGSMQDWLTAASAGTSPEAKQTADGLRQYFAGMRAAGLTSEDQLDNSQEGWDAGLEINWAMTSAGTLDETAVMHKLQHLNINTLGIVWNRTPSDYEKISQVLAAMETIAPDGKVTLYR